jgi:hypothetical protein
MRREFERIPRGARLRLPRLPAMPAKRINMDRPGTDLMLASVLRLIGLDKAQEAFKLALEEKAHEAVDDVKGVVVRMVVVAAWRDFCAAGGHHWAFGSLRLDGAHLRDIPGA